MRPFISDDQRRARLLSRQLLDGQAPGAKRAGRIDQAPGAKRAGLIDQAPPSCEALTDTIVGLHATTASTIHLSAWARDSQLRTGQLEAAMYEERSLVKQLAMRRTLFVLTRPQLRAAVGAIGERVAASERTNLLRDLRRDSSFPDPEAWIDEACAAVTETLDDRLLSTPDLRAELAEFDRSVMVSPDKPYGGPSPLIPRILNHLAARGAVVRGSAAGTWYQPRHLWTSMSSWLGEELSPMSAADGHIDLVARWLRTYGPGTETDLVWWLGSTKTAVRKALSALEAVDVDLESGDVGYLLPDDLDPVEPVPPRALLLPALDPTTMGYKERDFYLGPHAPELFDSTGNGGQTAWWDGRIVGGWVTPSGSSAIEVVYLEDVPAQAKRAFAERAEELAEWFGEDRPAAGFPSPLMKRHR